MPGMNPYRKSQNNEDAILDIHFSGIVRQIRVPRNSITSAISFSKKLKRLMNHHNPDDIVVLLDKDNHVTPLNSKIPNGTYTMLLPPWLSCKSWAIADPTSISLMYCKNESQIFPPASLTKMMSLYVIVNFYRSDVELMKSEIVKVTNDAAELKNGTHASLLHGDKLPVYDLLYGMMLPSGNDAAAALAIHVGKQLRRDGLYDREYAYLSSYDCFVTLMNSTASNLGLLNTNFMNPHGMKEAGHYSTAKDLAILGCYLCQNPLMVKICGTRSYRCTIQGKKSLRISKWTNTHILLNQENDYICGKTGWVPCSPFEPMVHGNLWSIVKRNQTNLCIITLDSPDRELRFVDTSKLVDWSFRMVKEAQSRLPN